MGKCVLCGTPTVKTAWDMNTGEFFALCETCKEKEFEKCSVCGEYRYKDELVDGKCEYCREENDGR